MVLAALSTLLVFCFAHRAEAFVNWVEDGDAIGRANLDGSGVDRTFINQDTDASFVRGVTVNDGGLFWTSPYGCTSSSKPDSLGHASLGGTGIDQSFVKSPTACGSGIAVEGNYVYWIGSEGSLEDPASISRATLDGSVIEPEFIVRDES